jgi:ATP-dependent 26S proteasome regulatory subunit
MFETEAERWKGFHYFSDTMPLLRAGVIQKVDDPYSPSGSSRLAQFLKLDVRICRFLLGSNQTDARLGDFVTFFYPTGPLKETVDAVLASNVTKLVEHYLTSGHAARQKLVMYLYGPDRESQRDLALQTCQQFGSALLSLDVELLLTQGTAAPDLLRLAFREGLLQQASLFLEHADVLLQETARPLLKTLEVAISEYGWMVFLSGTSPWISEETFTNFVFHPVELPIPETPLRTMIWRNCLSGRVTDAEGWAGQLAEQFRLTPAQIRAAVQLAENRRLMSHEAQLVTLSDLAAACRHQSNQKLSELSLKIEPRYGWDDIVLPEDAMMHLREICSHVKYSRRVFQEWGFGRKLSRGKGLSVLFSGPPGTGKTMAAEVIAHDLQLDLYKIDLSNVVSKYIGETEKNLAKIFAEAETSNAILFFDEADALFGKRTEISDAHDRYANIETSYLLQKMEEYEGMVILASNLRENMDDAFIRRIRFIVEFPFPDEASRLEIWRRHFPSEAPVDGNIDYEYLSREFKIAGGSIKNIVLSSAFLAAANGGVITIEHIRRGAKREFGKMGKLWNELPSPGVGKA